MKLKGKIDNEAELTGLGEAFAGCYTKSGDAWLLDVDLAGTGYDTALVKIKAERTQLKEQNEKLSHFSPLLDLEGFEVGKAGDYMQKAATAENTDVDKAVEDATRPLIKQLEAAKIETGEFKLLSESSTSDKKNYIISDQVTKAAIKAGVLKDSVEDVYTLTKGRFALDEGNKVSVVDGEGDITGASLNDFFNTEFKEAKPYMYGAVPIKGSGSSANQGKHNEPQKMSSVDKISAGLSGQ
tara:strand:+ start:373 stop:1092 length:720 start_codon:yes stop_codon:yes gene_type:complete